MQTYNSQNLKIENFLYSKYSGRPLNASIVYPSHPIRMSFDTTTSKLIKRKMETLSIQVHSDDEKQLKSLILYFFYLFYKTLYLRVDITMNDTN